VRKQKAKGNICFTPASRRHSSDDDDSDKSDASSSSSRRSAEAKSRRRATEIPKHKASVSDLERAKELSRVEAQRLREKLDALQREKSELEIAVSESSARNTKLQTELEKRPSYNEWTRLRAELNSMNKKLVETSKVASLRKYMDTRELIARDKQIHTLGLSDINALPAQIMKELLTDLCRALSLTDVTLLVGAVSKLSKCVECVPVLEQYISRVVRLLLASDHAPQLTRVAKVAPKQVFDQVLPVLQRWVVTLDKVAALEGFRVKVSAQLRKRTISKSNHNADKENSGDGNVIALALHEMVAQIGELVQSEEYLLSSKECFGSAEQRLTAAPEELSHRIVAHFQHIFSVPKLEGVFPAMNQIYLELNELRNFGKTVKSVLGLPLSCAVNLCFKELTKMVDDGNEQKFRVEVSGVDAKSQDREREKVRSEATVMTKWNDILLQCQALLQCASEDEIVAQCRELQGRCKEYDAVFPRVHNLVNQLRVTLNVEYAHQILPKVKEMVAREMS